MHPRVIQSVGPVHMPLRQPVPLQPNEAHSRPVHWPFWQSGPLHWPLVTTGHVGAPVGTDVGAALVLVEPPEPLPLPPPLPPPPPAPPLYPPPPLGHHAAGGAQV
ncbi:hypothetical protein ASPCADRAFT_208752 [Aspergillus carbonarius ITEM 5010]|uniref:Uncharacterized protein n=1 Tax=Aspergillus carbonarius (strain ITEM 5010) TaxID=602072 RepID=A0A1R3RIB2_ASPC5|nr:hypothetical protein ASPCADRAFT_208752 [Aspergillus carbonarius ITEM 5010]